jgi:hypothetical protein
VISWERFGDWIATVAVASFAWVSGLVAPGVAVNSPTALIDAPAENQLSSVMRWAQQEDEPPIEQVGEAAEQDVETLDEEAPPADGVDTTEDVELLDQGPPVADQQDVELLDQGSPVATLPAAAAPSTVATVPVTSAPVPVTTNVAPPASSTRILPEGFGTGTVHVATGSGGFPVGLEDCHVGAVTGRAFVGIDCGEGNGSSFVGHAPSFEEFPFVVTESFPFDRESVFADRGESPFEDNVETLVSAARGATRDDNAAGPEMRSSGRSSVAFEQRARERKPRVETESGHSKRSKDKRQNGSGDVTASESQDAAESTTADSKHQKKKGKDRVRGGSAAEAQKKSTSSDNPKKHGGKKGKKNRARHDRDTPPVTNDPK